MSMLNCDSFKKKRKIKMKKKLIALVSAVCLIMMLSACGKQNVPQPDEPVDGGAAVVNPMHESSQEAILQELGLSFQIPAGAENVAFWTIGSNPVLAQMDFTFDGDKYTYRISTDSGNEDISGMYYEWEQTEETTVGGLTAEVKWIDWNQGVISWYDAAPGIQYSLSQDTNATFNSLEIMANALYIPVQGEADGQEEGFPEIMTGYLRDFRENYHPGTAGSSLTGSAYAARFMDLFTEENADAEEVRKVARSFADSLSSEEQSLLHEQFTGLKSAAEYLLNEKNAPDLLLDCGYEALYFPWNAEQMTSCFEAMENA